MQYFWKYFFVNTISTIESNSDEIIETGKKIFSCQQNGIMRPFIQKYHDSMRLKKGNVGSMFASKYAFHACKGLSFQTKKPNRNLMDLKFAEFIEVEEMLNRVVKTDQLFIRSQLELKNVPLSNIHSKNN